MIRAYDDYGNVVVDMVEHEKRIYKQALEDFENMIYENGYYDSFSQKITIYREDMERGISMLKKGQI